ncbi:MAG: energy-coupling factor ABC transporter permease [Candidatus Thiodiazotropha sp. (ex Lucina aurantia)]|uniref:Cobalt transport protein CbiM n=2 Tax=Candidatus Thiodiazotropha TaxID=1913444 RepID=A0A7Z0VLT0_9GAMM|nr:energy-coupling factor ABC transporter permease [Candidatus Thiodiazotropha endolucinida]MBT3011596.1 energy-coupling factor ABC transporter permease [Candidatus Thiodiazotropha sp. (ex Lucina pensylvanica)]MBT3016355.1 energy-coupling factor ABC transporter permease [Candidatus Thiodiazotropha taylori]MBT3039827.1 energy-coupling factor ABC transporter permease [Candidatus Thiodiazotropha sp. (ex Codakia orbicularis)]MBV2103970.1 energy-coupling factor ABC transporter permease [Candidatus T
MHIEPGVVEGAKIALSVVTAAGAIGYAAKLALSTVKQDGITTIAIRSVITTLLVFCFFEVLPHYPVGVSEVHFILGATLFLIFGAGPAAIGLATGLLIQGLLLAPADLPQYGMNVTSLLVPLLLVDALARRLIPAKTAYKDVKYGQALALSTAYQGGVIAWVAFWAFYGNGFGAENLIQVGSFSVAYLTVIIIEPLLDLAILATAKSLHQLKDSKLFHSRLYRAAV